MPSSSSPVGPAVASVTGVLELGEVVVLPVGDSASAVTDEVGIVSPTVVSVAATVVVGEVVETVVGGRVVPDVVVGGAVVVVVVGGGVVGGAVVVVTVVGGDVVVVTVVGGVVVVVTVVVVDVGCRVTRYRAVAHSVVPVPSVWQASAVRRPGESGAVKLADQLPEALGLTFFETSPLSTSTGKPGSAVPVMVCDPPTTTSSAWMVTAPRAIPDMATTEMAASEAMRRPLRRRFMTPRPSALHSPRRAGTNHQHPRASGRRAAGGVGPGRWEYLLFEEPLRP